MVNTGHWFDNSGFYEELAGYAEALGVGRADAFRSFIGNLGQGSTGFAATGKATADGGSITGRNVDWTGDNGILVPVVTFYHPNNNDLDFALMNWPLLPIPPVGMNESGLSLSYNFFNSDDFVSIFYPDFIYRRVLQQAKTVDEAVSIISASSKKLISAFITLSDANGNIALLECTVSECSRYDSQQDFIAVSNHSQTEEMTKHDAYRLYNSFLRLDDMKQAVSQQYGKITPEVAVSILQHRPPGKFGNDAVIANNIVLNSVVLHPKSRRFWHSDEKRPIAPFGRFIELSFEAYEKKSRIISTKGISKAKLAAEKSAVIKIKEAQALFKQKQFPQALNIINKELEAKILSPIRLLFFKALVKIDQKNFQETFKILEELTSQQSRPDIKFYSTFLRGWIYLKLGESDEAKKTFNLLQKEMEKSSEFNQSYESEDIKHRIKKVLKENPLELSVPDIHSYLYIL